MKRRRDRAERQGIEGEREDEKKEFKLPRR